MENATAPFESIATLHQVLEDSEPDPNTHLVPNNLCNAVFAKRLDWLERHRSNPKMVASTTWESDVRRGFPPKQTQSTTLCVMDGLSLGDKPHDAWTADGDAADRHWVWPASPWPT